MQNRMKTKAIPVFLCIGLLAFASCTIEQKLARTFIDTHKDLSFLIMKPSFVFKTNLKSYEIENSDSLSNEARDSILLAKSLFLQYVSDSTYISDYTESFSKELRDAGFRVYPEEYLDTFLTKGGQNVFIVNIAQLSLEEYVHPFSSDEQVGDEVVTVKDIDLNALNFNSWIELSPVNGEEKKNVVLFASDFMFDDVNGFFRQYVFSDKMTFEYTIDTIRMSDIYEAARGIGDKYADYLYDYILNRYISQNLPQGNENPIYYHYDRKRKTLTPAEEPDRFIEMKNQE
jgi:hypothetical protein